MLSVSLMGLRDSIDDNDPCTANPSDPICQLTAGDVAADPCKANPNASYCQASIIQQSSSLPTPGQNADTSSWTSFLNVLPSILPKPPTAATPTVTTTQPAVASTMAAMMPSKGAVVIGLTVVGLIVGVLAYRRSRAAMPAAA